MVLKSSHTGTEVTGTKTFAHNPLPLLSTLQDTIGGKLAYKGRLDLDNCQIVDLPDGCKWFLNAWFDSLLAPNVHIQYTQCVRTYCIARNFRGRKLSRISQFYGYLREVFSTKFGGVASFGTAKATNPRKFSPQISYFQQFVPPKFPAIQ